MRALSASAALLLFAASVPAGAKAPPPPPPTKSAASQVTADAAGRAIGELAGKFKFGTTPEENMTLIEKDINAKFQPRIEAEKEAADQDRVRKERQDAIAQMRDSYIKFNGQKTGWDVSDVQEAWAERLRIRAQLKIRRRRQQQQCLDRRPRVWPPQRRVQAGDLGKRPEALLVLLERASLQAVHRLQRRKVQGHGL